MNNINIINSTIRTFFVLYFHLYIFMKIINIDKDVNIKRILSILIILITSIIAFFITEKLDSYYSVIFQLLIMVFINIVSFKKDIGYTIINTIISLGISYLILFIAILISFLPKELFKIENDYIFLAILILIYIILVFRVLKIKKIKKGLIFLKNKIDNDNLDIFLLDLSTIFLFIIMILDGKNNFHHIVLTMFIITAIIIITIKKSLNQYYKHNLLVKELEETKAELEIKNKKVEELEKENLNFSKTSHSLAHKQKALEYKINELLLINETNNAENCKINNAENGKTNNAENSKSNSAENITKIKILNKMNSEISSELSLKYEIEKLSKEVYKKQVATEFAKTDILKIDNMLKYMQSQAMLKNIEFDLQINGSIFYMTNHYISVNELEIMLADHIKDAIIAIEHSDNENRSILVKLGKMDECYGLYIYDSGRKFEKEVLDNLGKRPITTYKDEGGTGMGFMNTFDVLRKYKASLIIEELNKPNIYTKVLKFKFDGKNEFKIISF